MTGASLGLCSSLSKVLDLRDMGDGWCRPRGGLLFLGPKQTKTTTEVVEASHAPSTVNQSPMVAIPCIRMTLRSKLGSLVVATNFPSVNLRNEFNVLHAKLLLAPS